MMNRGIPMSPYFRKPPHAFCLIPGPNLPSGVKPGWEIPRRIINIDQLWETLWLSWEDMGKWSTNGEWMGMDDHCHVWAHWALGGLLHAKHVIAAAVHRLIADGVWVRRGIRWVHGTSWAARGQGVQNLLVLLVIFLLERPKCVMVLWFCSVGHKKNTCSGPNRYSQRISSITCNKIYCIYYTWNHMP